MRKPLVENNRYKKGILENEYGNTCISIGIITAGRSI